MILEKRRIKKKTKKSTSKNNKLHKSLLSLPDEKSLTIVDPFGEKFKGKMGPLQKSFMQFERKKSKSKSLERRNSKSLDRKKSKSQDRIAYKSKERLRSKSRGEQLKGSHPMKHKFKP